MKIRKAEFSDLDIIMEIFKKSKQLMKELGNGEQWNPDYPSRNLIESDIENGIGYVVTKDEEVILYFCFIEDKDEPVYKDIEWSWVCDKPSGVIHRCVSGGSRIGAAQFMLDWCFEQKKSVKVDTKSENIPMINLLEKNGYKYCGLVYYSYSLDGGERMAFQKCEEE